MSAPKIGIILLGSGGPTPGCCERRPDCDRGNGCEAACFAAKAYDDNPEFENRIAALRQQVEAVGGFSEYNEQTYRQRDALHNELARRGIEAVITCGFRNWPPWYQSGLQQLMGQYCDQVIPVVLAPHQNRRAWDGYYLELAAVLGGMSTKTSMRCLEPTAAVSGQAAFITAQVDVLQSATADWSAEQKAATQLVFCAQAISKMADRKTPEYREQIEHDAAAIAAAADWPDYAIAFANAPPDVAANWSQPTPGAVIQEAAERRQQTILCLPLGYLVDQPEVTHGLDIAFGQQCEQQHMQFTRVRCLQDHPAFIACLADSIQARLNDV